LSIIVFAPLLQRAGPDANGLNLGASPLRKQSAYSPVEGTGFELLVAGEALIQRYASSFPLLQVVALKREAVADETGSAELSPALRPRPHAGVGRACSECAKSPFLRFPGS
jgi:hypothetical protein